MRGRVRISLLRRKSATNKTVRTCGVERALCPLLIVLDGTEAGAHASAKQTSVAKMARRFLGRLRPLALLLLLALFATTVALPPEPADEPVAEHSEDEVKEAREEFESIVSSSRFFEKLSPSCAHALNYSFSRCALPGHK